MQKYDNLLAGKFLIPNVSSRVKHAYHLYPLQIDFEKFDKLKIDFFKDMRKVKIVLQVHYIPIHLQPYYKRHFGFSDGDFPESEKFYNETGFHYQYIKSQFKRFAICFRQYN